MGYIQDESICQAYILTPAEIKAKLSEARTPKNETSFNSSALEFAQLILGNTNFFPKPLIARLMKKKGIAYQSVDAAKLPNDASILSQAYIEQNIEKKFFLIKFKEYLSFINSHLTKFILDLIKIYEMAANDTLTKNEFSKLIKGHAGFIPKDKDSYQNYLKFFGELYDYLDPSTKKFNRTGYAAVFRMGYKMMTPIEQEMLSLSLIKIMSQRIALASA